MGIHIHGDSSARAFRFPNTTNVTLEKLYRDLIPKLNSTASLPKFKMVLVAGPSSAARVTSDQMILRLRATPPV
jgi:hypothetical protein